VAETVILCGGAPPPARVSARLDLALGGPNPNVNLSISDISRRLVSALPNVLTDLLEIASYVFCADQLVSRGGETASRLGMDWRRHFHFIIPVREPDLWSATEVKASLERLISVMSDA